jgi:hypothetical protein
MVFPQLGHPVGNPPYHPDGPPWLAGLGLRRWYTYLVYTQQATMGPLFRVTLKYACCLELDNMSILSSKVPIDYKFSLHI